MFNVHQMNEEKNDFQCNKKKRLEGKPLFVFLNEVQSKRNKNQARTITKSNKQLDAKRIMAIENRAFR